VHEYGRLRTGNERSVRQILVPLPQVIEIQNRALSVRWHGNLTNAKIRNSKSETNSKLEIQMLKTSDFEVLDLLF
jgi:hypothetical protein